ncbi:MULTISPECIES: tRNA pseudouridine(38-40) synthase TruA [unclassified Undibacterium]|uniref:tRNA pseudouridine(38-40) synthase TruA n=1 Tax=unclassified Undibacterium TaxID=2630295 RepID=UPI002AC97B4A|nr:MULTISPECIES: tRNA pseudouridine(38-40) synthase TruA [unclassified Undibacterium]MEB0138025.1 tRNA pseudouridine(38-40) synthase TruA [Undibacterium sp. CCC2.1]MEB0171237.1 tRNA pseudouridine(38-40) synthase TruA [Undibacterium sp. CCC1.1]MEB0175282.1 tRNA pseudouridine(38-40) synthase TruA [Undibacterium sp. CCC3.4]MEB0216995.1 tRNA pseudouridine(38-40) synthase TruA [Undibacterium sp. 5I2]WPX42457.1 tRNA pseudouridine(38-40) synthase TruA [Undibacterium sp. CCC3.4]
MKRLVLGVQYDGADWHGWQTQPDGHTVQDALERALQQFCGAPVSTVCAGRTDAGVHGLEQVVHFDSDLRRAPYSWVNGVNAFLPASIAVQWAKELPLDPLSQDNFHARFSARARTYHYVLYNARIRKPMWVGRAGWVFRPLEVEPMREAARHLIGEHDFSAFRAAACQAKTPVKHLYDLQIRQQGELIVFSLRASAFLHHMVRNIVGSLLAVGQGKHSPEWLAEVLQSRDRSLAAPTFMPDGLYLAKIDYEKKWELPQAESDSLPDFLSL